MELASDRVSGAELMMSMDRILGQLMRCILQAELATESTAAGLKRIMREPYHVRVLVPCYKEPLDILQRTVTAALHAHLPQGCRRTVYLCDDGKDPGKKAW